MSVALNVREGNVFTVAKKKNFFMIAFGSLHEVDECMIIMKGLCYVSEKEFIEFRDTHYWLCLNKLRKLIQSVNS